MTPQRLLVVVLLIAAGCGGNSPDTSQAALVALPQSTEAPRYSGEPTYSKEPTYSEEPAVETEDREPSPVEEAVRESDCDDSYPDVCIPPISVSGDLDCDEVGFTMFEVRPPDPHGFDGDDDGWGCES